MKINLNAFFDGHIFFKGIDATHIIGNLNKYFVFIGFVIGIAIVIIIFVMGGVFMYVAHDRQQKYPQYGDGLFPNGSAKKEEKYIYIGR